MADDTVVEVTVVQRQLEGVVVTHGKLMVFAGGARYVFDLAQCKPFALAPGLRGPVVRLWLEAEAQVDGPPLVAGEPLTFEGRQINSQRLCDRLNTARNRALSAAPTSAA